MLSFWNHLKTLEGYKYHTLLHSLTSDELKKAIPCCIYGDGAEMFRDDEFWIMNWSSAFASGGGHDCWVSRYPILIVPERQMRDETVFWLGLVKLKIIGAKECLDCWGAKHLIGDLPHLKLLSCCATL